MLLSKQATYNKVMLLGPGRQAPARRSLLRIMRIHYNHTMRFG
jgi:hypothetical protein